MLERNIGIMVMALVGLWASTMHSLYGEERKEFDAHTGRVTSVALCPDGTILASGSKDKTIRIWDVRTGESKTPIEHADVIISMAFSPDGKMLASGSDDGIVKHWDVANREELAAIDCHKRAVRCAAFSRDGETLATGDREGNIVLWDVKTGRIRKTIHGQCPWMAAFTPDGKTLVSVGDDEMMKPFAVDTLRLWDVETGES